MKLLVDEMPSRSDKCPFYTYNGSHECKLDIFEEHLCYDVTKCPFLKVFEEKKENKNESLSE